MTNFSVWSRSRSSREPLFFCLEPDSAPGPRTSGRLRNTASGETVSLEQLFSSRNPLLSSLHISKAGFKSDIALSLVIIMIITIYSS